MLFCAGVVMTLYGGHAAVYYKAGAADDVQPLILAPLVLTLTQLTFYSVSFAGILQLHEKIEITSTNPAGDLWPVPVLCQSSYLWRDAASGSL